MFDLAADLAADLEREFPPNRKELSMDHEDRPTMPKGYGYENRGLDASAQKSAYIQAQIGRQNRQYEGDVAVPESPPESPITRLARAVDRLANAAAFTHQTSDLLCGSARVDGKGSPDVPAPDGMFSAMNMLTVQIERHTDTIQLAMDRIHKIGG